MENITLGQIAIAVAFIAALITGGVKIKESVKKWLENLLKEKFDTVNNKIDAIEKCLTDVDIENCKNYLVTYLSEVKRGETKDEIERQRFWEEYKHYIDKGGNSYIRHDVDELGKKELL